MTLKIYLGLMAGLVMSSGFGNVVQAAESSAAAPSLLTGAFTEAQAVNGQTLYYEHCLQCHGESMNGVDQAPPLAGPQFAGNWTGESLLSLVERMNTMPPDKPGTLSREQVVDLLTFILWFNELPLGTTPLATDREALAELKFETSVPGY